MTATLIDVTSIIHPPSIRIEHNYARAKKNGHAMIRPANTGHTMSAMLFFIRMQAMEFTPMEKRSWSYCTSNTQSGTCYVESCL